MTQLVGKKPTPILLMARHLEQGGLERDLTKLALHIDRSRFEPHVATYFDTGMRLDELRHANIQVLHVPVTSIASRSAFHGLARLCGYIRERGIRLIHAFDSTALLATIAARCVGVPVITSQLSYRSILDKRTALILRISDRLTDVVHVNCEAMKRYMIEDEHVPAERVFLCYNGVDTNVFFPAPISKPAASVLVVGIVCALRPEKNVLILQQAFANVRSYSPGMRLRIVGGGPELGRLQENAARLGIAEVTEFIPASVDVAEWMHSMDIFVLPSYSEAFSNSLLEAMACGCAVIGSRVGGTPELIGDNERGLLFERGDVRGLTTKLERFIRNETYRRQFGVAAAKFARENLNLQLNVARHSENYEKLLGRMPRFAFRTLRPLQSAR